MKKLNRELFIEKSKIVHGDKFNYDLVEYKNVRTTVKIICPKCGVFEQLPWTHMKGIGCSKCNLQTKDKFIEKSIKKHGYKYNYDNINFIDNKTKIDIMCNTHGIFEQTPKAHLQGQGCYKCFIDRKALTTQKFIEKSIKKHGEIYDYSYTNYISSSEDVEIICVKHGSFMQNANHHLNGSGCPKCVRIVDTQNFISKSVEIHGNIFDYSKTFYYDYKTKIKIICKEHGEFLQTPNSHLQGCGCPTCSLSKGEIEISKFLDNHNIQYEKQKKFRNCKNKAFLPFDFYLSKYNLCIEYQGRQHYLEINFFGGLKSLKYQQNNDKIKKNFCKNSNIKLLIIKYDENILSKLYSFFFI